MSKDEIEKTVIELVSEQMGVDSHSIDRNTHLINDLNADSLDSVELIMELEDEFDVIINDDDERSSQISHSTGPVAIKSPISVSSTGKRQTR
jgi:acyl carrier protein